jgi:DNA-binding IclR family transcriptional regulator
MATVKPERRPNSLKPGSISRVALLLRTLSTFGAQGAALKAIAAASGLPKPSVHRMLAALAASRLIEKVQDSRDYRLGPELFAFGTTIAEVADLRGLARPSLERIAAQAGGVAYLGIRSGFDALCIDRADGPQMPPELALDVMDRWPLGIGVFSLVLLAFLPATEIREIVDYNRRRENGSAYFSVDSLLPALEAIRRDGFAFRAQVSQRNLAGAGVPVFDAKRRPVASLSVVGMPSLFDAARLGETVAMLRREAAEIRRLNETARRARVRGEAWREWLDPAR